MEQNNLHKKCTSRTVIHKEHLTWAGRLFDRDFRWRKNSG